MSDSNVNSSQNEITKRVQNKPQTVGVRITASPSVNISANEIYDSNLPQITAEDVKQPGELPPIIRAIQNTNASALPGLVIAIVGDSESFVPRPWNAPAFTSGLMQTVSGANESWLIYRGKEDGVSSLIFDAFKDDIISPNDDWQTTLIAIKPKTEPLPTEESNLPNWTFLLDPTDSSVHLPEDNLRYNWYNEYLSSFLSTLSEEYTTLLADDKKVILKMRVPVLLVVVEGDITTIQQVLSAVEQNVPVLIVKGSGKAANLMADYLRETDNGREKLLREKAPLLFGIYIQKNQFESLKEMMENIASYHFLITLFDVDNPGDDKMEEVVVEAIIKGWSLKDLSNKASNGAPEPVTDATVNTDRPQTITCNAVDWGEGIDGKENKGIMEHYQVTLTPGSLSLYFYIAYQVIQEWVTPDSKKKDLQLLLLEAIVADRVDYVSALMQSGVQFESAYMERLYDETLRCPDCDGKDCRKIHAIHNRISSKSCAQVWCTCSKSCKKERYENCQDKSCRRYDECGPTSTCQCRRHNTKLFTIPVTTTKNKTYPAETETEKCNYINVFWKARTLCQELLNYPQGQPEIGISLDNSGNVEQRHRDEVYHDLLAWALFANRTELAGVFWTKCTNQLLTAVMASSILKNMAENVEAAKDRKLHEELLQHSKLFEERVLAMQNSLYEEKETECMKLMQVSDTIWGITVRPMECAYDNNMVDVIGHPCIQRLLDNTWYNKSASKFTQWLASMFGCNEMKNFGKAWTSPLMAFAFHYLFVLVLLFGYSAFILTDIQIIESVSRLGPYEWFLYIWLLGDIIEEILRNIVYVIIKTEREEHKWFRFKRYIFSFWNMLTLLSYIIILLGVAVRIVNSHEFHRMEIRTYSFGLFAMYMRFLQSMLVLSYFGPKIIMIGKMLVELLKIGWILLVFIMCTGVLYHANMYPSHYDMWSPHGISYWRIWKIVSLPYWQIYGELSLDEIKGDNNMNGSCTFVKSEWEENPDIGRCVDYDWAVMVIAAIYMLITNLLLINLVIALFSYRFEEVQSNSDRLWKFWRYSIITDFKTRYPVPFNLLIRPFRFFNMLVTCKCGQKGKDDKIPLEKEQHLHAVHVVYDEKIRKK